MHKADWSRPSTDGQFVGGMIHMLWGRNSRW
jgi:hypothetical protein